MQEKRFQERERIMELEFRSRHFTAEFESPFENFRKVEVAGEVRTCPLSGHITRILPIRMRQLVPADMESLISRSKAGCPFCPEAIETKTPRFTGNFLPGGGRIQFGETVIFPNAFPYDVNSAVAVITRQHFVAIGQFIPELLSQAFRASLLFFQRAQEVFPDARQALLAWNYMPLAGAGLIHPHFQLAALAEPTAFYRRILERARGNDSGRKKSIFEEIVDREIEEKSRYIARTGQWDWLTAFAPRAIYEFWGVFTEAANVLELGERDLMDLASGISRILKFLATKNIQAPNMTLYSRYSTPGNGSRNWVSIVPRFSYPGMSTSDVNYFDKLHGESIAFTTPEEVTLEVRKFFAT